MNAARHLPRVVIAAAASGQGKTTITTGLIAALRSRGLAVSPHKVGPDYIDPGYHTLAAGRPGRNLDPWLVGERQIAPLLLHGALTPEPADLAVVEGVMGLHDGASGRDDFASTAHLARLIDAPVILVIDASAQARSAAALALGMRLFDQRITVAGVILNRIGSPRHEAILRDALAEIDMPVLGAIGRSVAAATPSRHLGLIPAAERASEAVGAVAALGDLVTHTVDLDAVINLASTAPPLAAQPWNPDEEIARVAGGMPCGPPVRIALAAGAAFTFSYAETAELLTAAGAEVVTFDPLRDATLPEGTRGVIIGGGFPEEHADALSANGALRAELGAFVGPVYAECAGLLYLCHSLDDLPMCGLVPATARMTPHLTLGYREAVAPADTVVSEAGEVVRGHEFHRTVTDPGAGRGATADGPASVAAWTWDGAPHGFRSETVHASYLHTHWAGHPAQAHRFVRHARRSG